MAETNILDGLRAWTSCHDLHVRAAVQLLIDHDHWLNRSDFIGIATRRLDPHTVVIDFDAAAAALEEGRLGASSTEIGVLRLACDLGADRWRTSRMGHAASRAVRQAIITATS